MFAGIIKHTGKIVNIKKSGTNSILSIESNITPELHIDQSIAHNGVCLTVTNIEDNVYTVVAIKETLDRSNIGELETGDQINLEFCITASQKIDGHFVQGHVDAKGEIKRIEDVDGSWNITIAFPEENAALLVDKGSVCVNGISLTVINPTTNQFSVSIIPYTFKHTNLYKLSPGDTVNLEFDILGKYILRGLKLQEAYIK